MSLEDNLTEEQRIERAAARDRLDKEVAEIKRREEAGERKPTETRDERNARLLASQGIVSVGDILKEVNFEKMAHKTARFAARLKEKLAEMQPEYCIDHEDTELPIDYDRSFSESWFSKIPVRVLMECPRCLEDRKASLVNEKFIKMGIPYKVLHATFDNFEIITDSHRKSLAKVKLQVERKRGFLILRGTPGAGKSHLAAAALKQVGGLMVTLHDFIGELRNTYENGGQEDMVSRYREVECFVLDEFTKDVKGSDVSGILYRVLAHRYDRGKFTIITSNDSLGDILDVLGPRLKDRIKEDYRVATMEWDSYRGKHEAA